MSRWDLLVSVRGEEKKRGGGLRLDGLVTGFWLLARERRILGQAQ